MTEKGSLIVLSGFSGVGKGTVLRMLMETHDNYAYSVSATTRSPRAGEKDGKDYFFLTREEFESMIRGHELLEYARYVDNYYGTPKKYVEDRLKSGKDVILEIEVQGALNIRRMAPEAVLIYMLPPSADVLKERLSGRGTEEESIVKGRLRKAAEEAESIEKYDYVIVNDDAALCAERLHQLIIAQHLRTSQNRSFVRKIQEDLQTFRKES